MAYNLASVKRWLGITVNTYDTDLQALMDRALYAVQRELDWWFDLPRAASEVLDGTGNRALWIRQPPTDTPIVSTRSTVGGTWEVVAATEYEQDQRGFFSVGIWTRGVRNYRITYSEGFAVMPGDIEQLLLDIVSTKWKSRDTDPGMKSERIGDYSYVRGDLEDSSHWALVLSRWRRGRI